MPTKVRNQKAFLTAFAMRPVVVDAAEKAGIGRSTVYSWLEDDPEFRAKMDNAEAEALERLEKRAHKIAEDDDPAMIRWILSRRNPKKWGDQQRIEHSGEIQVRTLADIAKEASGVDDA